MVDLSFFKGKKVFLTGHTGFKGAWMCEVLLYAGADVTGYALEPPTQPALFELIGLKKRMHSIIGDIRDLDRLKTTFKEIRPEIVLHMAAQPIVRESYLNPVYTYDVNVMGTVNILECIRLTDSVKSFVNVTTDKVYKNKEWEWGYRENEELNGYDPYSNSKSCSELMTHSYKNSFFADSNVAISTARAGNVIGGGDFANDRVIPDCVRAVRAGKPMGVRNPQSTRPYQHVLEPLFAYLMICQRQYEDGRFSGWYNVGPDECDCVTTGQLVAMFQENWGKDFSWIDQSEPNTPHEANFLKLDSSKLKAAFGWTPRWHITEAIKQTIAWTRVWLAGDNIPAEMDREIDAYLGC